MNLKKIISRFGYLLPDHQRVNNYQFAKLIKDNYLLSNPIVLRSFDWLRSKPDFYFKREFNNIKVIKI